MTDMKAVLICISETTGNKLDAQDVAFKMKESVRRRSQEKLKGRGANQETTCSDSADMLKLIEHRQSWTELHRIQL